MEREVPKLPYDELLILVQDQTEQLVALKQELEQLKRMLILKQRGSSRSVEESAVPGRQPIEGSKSAGEALFEEGQE